MSRYIIEGNLIRYRLTALTALVFYGERLLTNSRAKRHGKNRTTGKKTIYLLRRDGEEYRKVKDHMVSFMEQLEKEMQL